MVGKFLGALDVQFVGLVQLVRDLQIVDHLPFALFPILRPLAFTCFCRLGLRVGSQT